MQANATQSLSERALVFIRQAQGSKPTAHHNDLLARCAAHLQVIHYASDTTAEAAAAKALAEYECRGNRAYIDIDASTSQFLVVRMPESGKSLVFSAAGLARIAAVIKPEDRHPSSLPLPKHVLWVGVDPCAPEPPK